LFEVVEAATGIDWAGRFIYGTADGVTVGNTVVFVHDTNNTLSAFTN
jgi:hypothetical protein